MKKVASLSAIAIVVIVAWAIAANANVGKSDKQQIIDLEHGLIEATNTKNVDGMMNAYDGSDRLIIFDAVPPLKYSDKPQRIDRQRPFTD